MLLNRSHTQLKAARQQQVLALSRPCVAAVRTNGRVPCPAAAPAAGVDDCAVRRQQQRRVCVRSATLEQSQRSTSFSRGTHWQVHKFGGTCMAAAERIRAAAEHVIATPGDGKVVVVSAMGSHPSSPLKVTDVILNMISKAAKQDDGFLLDLAALQDKHVATAKLLLGNGPELTSFVARLLDDMTNLKAMLQAMSIGA